jgi:hypothetical protein
MRGWLVVLALALPVALAGCPQFSSDWRTVGGGSSDEGADGAMTDGPTGRRGAEAGSSDEGADGTGVTLPEADASDAGASDSSKAGYDACMPSGTGAVGTLGCPCSPPAALACNGNAQKDTLVCSGGTWANNGTCGSGQLCDSQSGVNQGICQPIDPPCVSATPAEIVCSNSVTVVQCGPDLVSDSPIQTCMNQVCVSGACTGVCTPGTMQCCSYEGCTGCQVWQSCGSNGQWGSCGPATPPC